MESSHSMGGIITFIALFHQIYNKRINNERKRVMKVIIPPIECELGGGGDRWNILHCMKMIQKELRIAQWRLHLVKNKNVGLCLYMSFIFKK